VTVVIEMEERTNRSGFELCKSWPQPVLANKPTDEGEGSASKPDPAKEAYRTERGGSNETKGSGEAPSTPNLVQASVAD